MKTNRTIIYLTGIFLVLIAVWAFKTYSPTRDTDLDQYLALWSNFNPDQITQISLTKTGSNLSMQKNGNTWQAEGFDLNSALITDLATNLIKPTNLTLVSLTAAKHADLGVASDSAQLTLSNGTDQQSVHLGLTTSSGRYVRVANADPVYLIPELPAMAGSTTLNDWVDKTLTKIDQTQITQIKLDRSGKSLTLNQKDNQWTFPDNAQALDPTPFAALLSTLSSFTTQGLVPADSAKTFASTPALTAIITQTDNQSVTLTFYSGKDTAMVVSSARAGQYQIASSVLTTFSIDPTSLKPLPLASPEPSAAAGTPPPSPSPS